MPSLTDEVSSNQRLTQRQKNANDFRWYKNQADNLDAQSFANNGDTGWGDVTDWKRKKVNYDLFNNIINLRDFEYVCKPFGGETGELPANMVNRDIVSGKIKVLLGMEMTMPFSWKVAATNPEATTRREQAEFGEIKKWVTSEIMRPIHQEIQQATLEEQRGRKLSPEELQQLQQQVAQQTKAATPPEVKKYMVTKHQDPAENQAHQILEYLIQDQKMQDKFNKGFKHLNLSSEEVYCIEDFNGNPTARVVNSLYFDSARQADNEFVQDDEWAVEEMRMTPSQIVSTFSAELTEAEIDRIFDRATNHPSAIADADFTFDTDRESEQYHLRVLHCTWKSLMKIGFLSYRSKLTGGQELKLVDENYKLNVAEGDIAIDWDWIPQTHEVYKILNDIYCFCRPVPGQFKDLDNLYECKLPYVGVRVDAMNSVPTCSMDRMKAYQYFFDVIIYRIELLMASDKGKAIAFNINAIPKSLGVDLKKFMYFLEANKIAFLNPNEEGNKMGGDVTNMAKEIDMSLVSDIFKYMQLADSIEARCGRAIGVTPQMEAQIAAGEAVTNAQQNIIQSSHIIRPLFELHNRVKADVLTALLERAKVCWSQGTPKKLSYILDDMTLHMLTVDQGLLDSASFGLYVGNSAKAGEAKKAIEALSQAAMQNQQASLLDIVKVIRSESITEAEEFLEVSQQEAEERMQAGEQAKIEAQQEADVKAQGFRREEWKHEADMIVLKETERRKTEVQTQAMLSMGFDPNKDEDDDGTPDVLEVAKFGVDAEIKRAKLAQDDRKLDHQIENDAENNRLQKEKLKIDAKKAAQKPASK